MVRPLYKVIALVAYIAFFFNSSADIISKLYLGVLVFFFLCQATWTKHDRLQIYFGVPGSGKTTFLAWYAKQAKRQHIRCLSNVPIKTTYRVERSDIGKYHIARSLLLIDEGSIYYNNRAFKGFAANENEWWTYIRHYKVEGVISSQGPNDVDKRLRTIADRLYFVQKSFIPYFIVRKTISKIVDIDGMTHDIVDAYRFAPLSSRYIFAPALWNMFDSFDAPRLPDKPGGWQLWYSKVKSDELLTDADGNRLVFNIDLCENI